MGNDKKQGLDTKKILIIGLPIILLLLGILFFVKNGQSEEEMVSSQEEAFLPESNEETAMSKREAYEQEELQRDSAARAANANYSDADFFGDMMGENVDVSGVEKDFEGVDMEAVYHNARNGGGSSVTTVSKKTSAKTSTGSSTTTKKTTTTTKKSTSTKREYGYDENGNFNADLARQQIEADRMADIRRMQAERTGRLSGSSGSSATSGSSSASSVKFDGNNSNTTVATNTGTRSRTATTKTTAQKNLVSACIHGDQVVTAGGTVRMRLLEDLHLDGVTIPASTIFYGTAQISGERMMVSVKTLRYGDHIADVKVSVYDNDAIEGLNLPDNVKSQIAKMASANSTSGANTDVASVVKKSNPVTSIVTSTVGTVVDAAKSIGANRIQEVKVNLKSNYKIYIR